MDKPLPWCLRSELLHLWPLYEAFGLFWSISINSEPYPKKMMIQHITITHTHKWPQSYTNKNQNHECQITHHFPRIKIRCPWYSKNKLFRQHCPLFEAFCLFWSMSQYSEPHTHTRTNTITFTHTITQTIPYKWPKSIHESYLSCKIQFQRYISLCKYTSQAQGRTEAVVVKCKWAGFWFHISPHK